MAALSPRLLEISAEIRIRIYELLFADAALAVRESPQESVIVWKARPNYLLTCRTIRHEALSLFCSAMTLLVRYDSGFVVPDWIALHEPETAGPEPADWKRVHIRDWTGFPSLISSTYLSGVERAVIHCDQSTFSSFILNLHNLPKLKYLEIRPLGLQVDEPEGGFPDVGLLVSDADEAVVESETDLFGSNGYLGQLRGFFSQYSRCFKARVIFPVKVNGLQTHARIDVDGIDLTESITAIRKLSGGQQTLDRLLSERLKEGGQSNGDTDRKVINEFEESPESGDDPELLLTLRKSQSFVDHSSSSRWASRRTSLHLSTYRIGFHTVI